MGQGPIPLLSEAELRFLPEEPEFEALAAEELGVAGTELDGFEAELVAAADGLVAGTEALRSLDPDLDAAAADFPAPGQDIRDELLPQLGEALPAGDRALEQLEAAGEELPAEPSETDQPPGTTEPPTVPPPETQLPALGQELDPCPPGYFPVYDPETGAFVSCEPISPEQE